MVERPTGASRFEHHPAAGPPEHVDCLGERRLECRQQAHVAKHGVSATGEQGSVPSQKVHVKEGTGPYVVGEAPLAAGIDQHRGRARCGCHP